MAGTAIAAQIAAIETITRVARAMFCVMRGLLNCNLGRGSNCLCMGAPTASGRAGKAGIPWPIFLSAVALNEPEAPYFDCVSLAWSQSLPLHRRDLHTLSYSSSNALSNACCNAQVQGC